MKQSHQKIYVAVYFLKTTDSAFSKLLELENSQLRNEYFNSWVFLCISLVGPWKTEDLSDARREPHRASFPLFDFFFVSSCLGDQSLGEAACVHSGNHYLVISLDITHKMCG